MSHSDSRYTKRRRRSRSRSPRKDYSRHETSSNDVDNYNYHRTGDYPGKSSSRRDAPADLHLSRDSRTHRHEGSSKICSSFDIKKFKSYFDRMFFRSYDVIVSGSPQHDDFWKFYDKIQSIQQQHNIKSQSSHGIGDVRSLKSDSVTVGKIHLPGKYSKKLTIPFHLQFLNTEDYISNLIPG